MTVKNNKIQAPKLAKVLEPVSNEDLQAQDVLRLNDGILEQNEIDGEGIEQLSLDALHLKQVTFTNASYKMIEWTDVLLENCDLSNLDLSDAVFRRVVFRNCKLVGLNLSGATIQDVIFEDCFAKYLLLGYSRCRQVLFKKCLLQQSDFYEAVAERTYFEDCELDQANLAGVPLEGMDLSTCLFESLVIGSLEKLAGCIVSTEQAIGFAKALGLVVKDN